MMFMVDLWWVCGGFDVDETCLNHQKIGGFKTIQTNERWKWPMKNGTEDACEAWLMNCIWVKSLEHHFLDKWLVID